MRAERRKQAERKARKVAAARARQEMKAQTHQAPGVMAFGGDESPFLRKLANGFQSEERSVWRQLWHELSNARDANLMLAVIAGFTAWIITQGVVFG